MYNSVSSNGDGISSLGFKSSSRGKSCAICIIYGIVYVLLGAFFVSNIIGDWWWTSIVDAILLIILLIVHVVCCLRFRETEVNLDAQTRKVIVKSKHTHFSCCFHGDGEGKEFPLDYVQSIDQTASGLCDKGRQVGITVRLSTGETYTPPRPFFNPADVARMQEFVQRFRLGVLNVASPHGPGAYYPTIPLNMHSQAPPASAPGLPPTLNMYGQAPTVSAYGLSPPALAFNQPLSAPLYYLPPQPQTQQMVNMGDNYYYGNPSHALPTLPAPIPYPGQQSNMRAPLVANGENL